MFYLTHEQTLADQRLFADGYEQYVEDTHAMKRAYDGDVCGLMNQYDVETEYRRDS